MYVTLLSEDRLLAICCHYSKGADLYSKVCASNIVQGSHYIYRLSVVSFRPSKQYHHFLSNTF